MPRTTTRGTTDGSLGVDVRYLARQGMLKEGFQGSLTWRSGEREVASIGVATIGDVVRFRFENQSRRVDLPITLDYTMPGHIGGWRSWFLCPECSRRCAILYAPRFACRLCLDLSYESQRTGRRFLALKKTARILAKLGGGDSIPPRPKGMTHRIYDGLCREYTEGLHAFAGEVLEGAG